MSTFELPPPDDTWPESAISAYQALGVMVQAQTELLSQQSEQLLKQEKTIQALQERLSLNSSNSGKPPSSDRKDKKSPKKRKRKPSSRSRGGQPGRKGATRELLEPTEVIESAPPAEVCTCGGGEWIPRGNIERFQVTELPKITPEVIEYQRQSYDCSCCGIARYTGGPGHATQSRFGPRLQSYVIYLSVKARLSMRQIKANLEDFFGVSISLGAVSDIITRGGRLSKPHAYKLKQWFKDDTSPKHVDETGWSIAGERAYLIGSLNRYASVFSITPRKSRAYIQELIGDDVSRVIISDRAPQYFSWFARQLCWSYVLRTFDFLAESHGSKMLGAELVECARALFRANRAYRADEISTSTYMSTAWALRFKVRALLKKLEVAPRISSLARGKVAQLLDDEDQLWVFIIYPELPIENNAQERELRAPVIKRKLSFGNDSEAGADRFAHLLSAIMTLRRQSRDVLDWLNRLFVGGAPSLLPQLDS